MKNKSYIRLLGVLLTLCMLLTIFPVTAMALDIDEAQKEIVISADDGITAIQDAITRIYNSSDKTDWTIKVGTGTYSRFVVLSGLDGLTICADERAEVTIKTLDGTSLPDEYMYSGWPETGGVQVRDAENVTFEGLTFKIVDSSTYFKHHMSAAISTFNEAGVYAQGMEVRNCTFVGDGNFKTASGGEYGYTYGANGNTGISFGPCINDITVTGCTFTDLTEGIRYQNDNADVNLLIVTDNSFTGCAFAIHGYCGEIEDGVNYGQFIFTRNTVTGTEDIRCKVYFEEWQQADSYTLTISGNTFNYVAVGLVDIVQGTTNSGLTYENVLEDNTFDINSFVVIGEKSTNGSQAEIYSTFSSPDTLGYWALTECGMNIAELNGLTRDQVEMIMAAIDEANDEGSHVLSLENVNTFTWLKDAIYWVGGEAKTSYPGLDKVIVTDNGEEVKEDAVAAGDTVNFKLTTNVPDDLRNHIIPDVDEPGISTMANLPIEERGSYQLVIHDVMDDSLVLDPESIVVTLGDSDELIPVDQYTVSYDVYHDDGTVCDFEITIDLINLYEMGAITDADIDNATSITVTYTATLSEDAAAGEYLNTAWVTYPDDKSQDSTVKVYTYGVEIFKYDQADFTTGLSGAEFALYDEDSVTVAGDTVTVNNGAVPVWTGTSGNGGYVTIQGLDEGTYYLVETKAPAGYVHNTTPLEIVIPNDADADYMVNVKFANSLIPHTGGTGTAMFTIGGAVVLLAAGVLFICSRRNRKDQEN